MGTPCLNCGAELTGNFCANCGQQVRDVNISVKSLLVEFVESLFSLEFGFWQTFKRLVFFPGTLTAEYVAGRRKRYSSPIRLYLGTSLLFFFLVGFMGGDQAEFEVTDDDGQTQVLTGAEALDFLGGKMEGAENDSARAEVDSLLSEIPAGDRLEKVFADPEHNQRRLMTYLPRAMFLMVPLLALLFRLVYVRHRRPYLHYLVFSLHLHALFYFTACVAGLLGRIPPEPVGDSLALLVLISFPVNTVRAQRRAFGDSWWKALLKAFFVWHVYGFLMLLVIFAVIALMVFTA